jgi:hypothetical protein
MAVTEEAMAIKEQATRGGTACRGEKVTSRKASAVWRFAVCA